MMIFPDGSSNITEEDVSLLADFLLASSFHDGTLVKRRFKISSYNEIPENRFKSPSVKDINEFVLSLIEKGVQDIYFFNGSNTLISDGRGGHACGQLRATTFNPGASPYPSQSWTSSA